MSRNENDCICSFCGKNQRQIKQLIAGENAFICNHCVVECMDIVSPKFKQNYEENLVLRYNPNEIPTPYQLKEKLDEYVIGQELAKKTLSVAVYNHYKRMRSDLVDDEVELQKSNVLMLGSSGSGKTLLASTLAKTLKVPFAIVDATTVTEAGYVGDDVENILLRLVQAADFDIELAERGIIYVDEVDKISRKSENTSLTRDVSGEGVQQALLKILEGTVANVPPSGGRKHPHQEFLEINTSNILFICGGAFDGIEKIIEQRVGKKGIGFGSEIRNKTQSDALLANVEPQDLLKFGLIPELIGRLPSVVSLETLDKNSLIRILTEPKNAIIKQYQKMLKLDGISLIFDGDAIEAIAEKAIERNTGARGLRAVLEEMMTDIMFHAPSNKNKDDIIITREMIIDVKKQMQ